MPQELNIYPIADFIDKLLKCNCMEFPYFIKKP